jgi:hypothetical protein
MSSQLAPKPPEPPVDQMIKAIAIGAAICAYFIQPLLRFADADRLVGGSCLAAASIVWGLRAYHSRSWAEGILAAGGAAFGFWLLASALTTATTNSTLNDRRCLALQRDMLSARPRRADGPDLFAALGCRPQGGGSVYVLPVR